jgi:lipoprotein-releasing system permease protein
MFEEQGVDQLTIKLHNPNEHLHLTGKTITDSIFWTTLWTKVTTLISNLIWPHDAEAAAIAVLQERLPHLVVCSWKDQYPALVSSLKLEKYVMFFILALITLVACMNMISLLFMQIQNKRRDIAIFKAMGMADSTIKNIFLGLGMRLTCYASLTGLTLAAIAGAILEHYPFITLPDVYYVSYLPARMDPELFIIVFAATMLMGFLATWIPARQSKNINISKVLRQ